ncbi:MAG: cytochrome c-type biogenesis CcmF C-terminal domain-containing protein, partial [Actinomycetota bacterium]
WWSYAVLGWGGYWGWDPVENASLLPWLTATAFIHSVMVQERRGMLRVWNLSLVIATFCLTILGTFLTRSGIVNSVHAFSESDIGPWFLAFLGACTFAGVGLVAWRGDRLRAPGRIDSPVSREAAFLLNNLLFGAFALVVLTGTVFPLLVEALQDRQINVGGPYFDRLSVPIGLGLLFLMAVGPALPWRAVSGEVLRHRLLGPAWAGGATLVIAVAAGARGIANVAAFALAAFVLASVARTVWFAVWARRRVHPAEGPIRAWVRTVRSNPRVHGGLLVHVGVIIIAVALATTGGWTTKRELELEPGGSAMVRGHRVTFVAVRSEESARRNSVEAEVRIAGVGVFRPAISSFPGFADGVGTPAIETGPWRDWYVTLSSAPAAGPVRIVVQVGTLVMWLWIGGLVMLLGTLLALVPARRDRPLVPAGTPESVESGSR